MVSRLDDVLFAPSGWFVIDAQNQRVPQVVVTSLQQGLGLVGRGRVASVVGRLVDGVQAVDVDLAGHRGHGVVEAIAGWCRARGLWHLVRPSGGAEGRAHVLVATQGHQDALEAFVEQLRTSWRASRTTIDLRTILRPLAAPHRTGAWTGPLGNLTDSLAALQQVLVTTTPGPPTRRAEARRRPNASGRDRSSPSVPLLPRRHRRRRDLPEPWETYLTHGSRPDIAVDQPGSRSNHEALATAHLLWAGYDADAAWARITTAHPKAVTKARSRGRAWWVRHVWDPAVRADDDFAGRAPVDASAAAAIAQAREQLSTSAWGQPERLRPYFLIVGHTVLDRMERTGQTRIPTPERDLVLDTGITDRRTLREHLARLERAGVLIVHRDTLDDTARATTSYEAEVPVPDRVGVLQQLPPPSSHIPLPERLPPGCPAHTWLILRALTETPCSPADLAKAAHLSPTGALSPGQVRTSRTALTVLSSIGLAECDERGYWRRGPGLTIGATQAADERQQQLRAVIDAERKTYREGRRPSWDVQRALAVKQQRAKEVAWWRGLSAAERARRRTGWARRFADSSVQEQQRVKTGLVTRERRRGLDPLRRHQVWVATNATEERRLERAEAYAALPPPLQASLARAWQEHRSQHGIPRDLLPAGRVRRELAALGPAKGIEYAAADTGQVGGRGRSAI